MDKKTSILLSTYNEAPVIKKTIDEIFKHVEDVEIVVTDDNSNDGTYEIIKAIKNNKLKVFSRKDRGLASAFLLSLINSSGEIVGWIDSNMNSLVPKIPEMIKNLEKYEIVLLSRFIEGGGDERSKIRCLSSKIINSICRLILSNKISDYTSSIFVMRREVLQKVVPISYGHGEFFIEFLYKAHKKGIKILEIPYVQPADLETISKTANNLFNFFFLGVNYIIRIITSLFRKN